MGTRKMNEPVAFLPLLAKGIGAVVGAVAAMILGGYIKPDGSFKLTRGLILNLFVSFSISIYGGSAFIDFYGLQGKTMMTHGFIMLMAGVLGMVSISVLYQAIALMRGKSLSEVATEVVSAFVAVKNVLWAREKNND